VQGPPLYDVPRRHANETLTVERPNLEGEFQDVVAKLEVLACRTVGVHKVRDACEVLATLPARRGRAVRPAWNNMYGTTHLRSPKVLRCAVTTETVGATPAELNKHAHAHALPALPRYLFFDNGVDAWMATMHFSCSESLFFDFFCLVCGLDCPRLEDMLAF